MRKFTTSAFALAIFLTYGYVSVAQDNLLAQVHQKIYVTPYSVPAHPVSKEESEKGKRELERLELMKEHAKREAERRREEHRNEVRSWLKQKHGMQPPGPVNR